MDAVKKNLWDYKEKHLKRILKAKTVSVTNPYGSNVDFQITLILLTKSMSFSLSKKILKSLIKENE